MKGPERRREEWVGRDDRGGKTSAYTPWVLCTSVEREGKIRGSSVPLLLEGWTPLKITVSIYTNTLVESTETVIYISTTAVHA